MGATALTIDQVLDTVRERAASSGVFGDVVASRALLECRARESGAPASYILAVDGDRLFVALVTPDRWMSQSIEQDLVHTGDKLEELLDEELADQGEPAGTRTTRWEHFRDDEKRYIFRIVTPVGPRNPTPDAPDTLTRWLLATEAMFRPLGDMQAGDE